ncbi:U-box domain-containing protein 26-like [Rutidosis leptorrhynchoides]|uniref:U-box domain-containing protein 26-like n=1 Tax=Rutidosis leptorrhynchoides TaxID=125765 RepID=UPI003A9A4E3D
MPASLQPLDIGIQIPYHFRCPISLELMTDPVIVGTGQTYDRSSIESWIATGNTTCPVTRLPLTDFTLIPNHTLRRVIQDWCVTNRSYGVERIPTPKQPADPVTVQSLLKQVSSVTNSRHVRLSAVRRLRGLARDSDKNRLVISSHKACEILLEVLFSDNSSELTHESLAVLTMLPLSETECVQVASNSDRISFLISLLLNSSIDVKINAAVLLENVVAGTRSADLRSEISKHDEIFDGIVGILDYPLPYPRALKVGIKALFALCMVKQHRHKAVEAGAVEALIDRLPDFEKCDAERALATVELLCRIPSGCLAFASHALTVPLLVKLILKISDRATEYAAGALLSLCSSAERLQKEAVAAGVLTQLLLLVQSDCTERAKRKAQMLLKLLRNSWPEKSIMNSDDFPCSDVVLF